MFYPLSYFKFILFPLQKWDYSAQEVALQNEAPTISKIVHAIGVNRKQANRNKLKKPDYVRNGLMTAAGVLLQCRNRNMNTHGMLTGLTLKRGGASIQTYKRLASRQLSVCYKTVLMQQTELGKDHDKPVRDWCKQLGDEAQSEAELLKEGRKDANQERHPGFVLVGDNVDLRVHKRQMTTSQRDTDLHYFNVMAVKNNINAMHLPDDVPISSLKSKSCSDFIPSIEDNLKLRENWVVLVGHTVAEYVPSLRWFKDHLPSSIPHIYNHLTSQKSEIVSTILR